MKIFSAEKTREWDDFTIKNEPIESIKLMDRAAEAFVQWFLGLYRDTEQPVAVFCGTGNNGGDGIAVARLLHRAFFDVKIFVCNFSKNKSPDFAAQIAKLPPNDSIPVIWLENTAEFPKIPQNTILIDAIFGSGISRPPKGDFEQIIQLINGLPNEVVSIDLPSGLSPDQHTWGECIKADRTFSFETPKLAFFFPENAVKTGEWDFGKIGLHPVFSERASTAFYYFTQEDASALYRSRQKFGHKGTYGHALLIAGSYGKMGAAVLASKACLRAGAGLLTVHTPACGYETMQVSVPEAMCAIDTKREFFSDKNLDLSRYTSIGIGSGIGQAKETKTALEDLLRQCSQTLVLDADALNILAERQELFDCIPKNSILTPHPKEFERLFGKTDNDFERNRLQREKAREFGVFILLKGAYSAIACPDGRCFFNSTGNPGMATGGSGDVLTGILTGLLAQGYPPDNAVLLGTFLHGLAGDLAAAEKSQEAMTASDLIDYLGKAWLLVSNFH